VSDDPAPDPDAREGIFSSERAKAFIDAVVAIAMTLLILPLMESVGESASRGENGLGWLQDQHNQLFSFVLSFLIIAMFWMNHHRLYARVDRVTSGLLWITMAWLLTIVWLPVATALSGQMKDVDTTVKVVYIGSMIATSLLLLAQRAFLRRHPELHSMTEEAIRSDMAVEISMSILFAAALILTVIFPVLGYYPMFLLLLSGPLQALIRRIMGVPEQPKTHHPR
jgi:uncharacterized membrane protein